jgi:hypothetical protein
VGTSPVLKSVAAIPETAHSSKWERKARRIQLQKRIKTVLFLKIGLQLIDNQ